MKTIVKVYFSLLSVLWFSPSLAQTAIGYNVHIGPLTINCADALGNSVMNYSAPTNQAAVATIINAGPAVVMNMQIMGNSSMAFNVFTYAHECAHHYLGHVINPNFILHPQQELDADCQAAKTTRNFGWLPPQYFATAMQTLYTFIQDSSHPPGPVRVQYASSCYSTIP